jgi:hypothetical protein
MKRTLSSYFSPRRALQIASALIAMVCMVPSSKAQTAISYTGGLQTYTIDPAGTTLPAGVQLVSTNNLGASSFGSLSAGTGGATGFYNAGGSTAFTTNGASSGTTGIAMVVDANTSESTVVALQNTTGKSFSALTLSAIVQSLSPAAGAIYVQYFISTIAPNAITAGTLANNSGGATSVFGWSATSAALTANVSGTGNTQQLSTTFNFNTNGDNSWDNNDYLYIRFYDPASSTSPEMSILGLQVTGVPEPSTWLTAALLLGFVGWRAIQKKKASRFLLA